MPMTYLMRFLVVKNMFSIPEKKRGMDQEKKKTEDLYESFR